MVELPDGARMRGRAQGGRTARRAEWGLDLLGKRPAAAERTSRWLQWPAFWLPATRTTLAPRSRRRTAARGTASSSRLLAAAEEAGRAPRSPASRSWRGEAEDATGWVRSTYDPRAVEMPWQRRYVRRFRARPFATH